MMAETHWTAIMEPRFPLRTMNTQEAVVSDIKEAGGTRTAMILISMVFTSMETIQLLLMASTGNHGLGIITRSNSLK